MNQPVVGFAFNQLPAIFQARWQDHTGWQVVDDTATEMSFASAAAVFSYALGVFEGMKAYRTASGWNLFRLDAHAARFKRSARALRLEAVPDDLFREAIATFLADNAPHIAAADVLYLRPLLLADNPQISLAPARSFRFVVIGTVAGSYRTGGGTITLEVVASGRVVPDGIGNVKTCANYTVSLRHRFAAERPDDITDVLYLDANLRQRVCETSTSNVFFVFDDGQIVTPSLNDEILAGITRDTLLQLAPSVLGKNVVERDLTIDEVMAHATEMFLCGTARAIQPVDRLRYRERERVFTSREAAEKLLPALQHCQRGAGDFVQWRHVIGEK